MHRIVTSNYKGQLPMFNTDYLWQSVRKARTSTQWLSWPVWQPEPARGWRRSYQTRRDLHRGPRLSIRGTRRPVFWRSELCLLKSRSYPLWRPGWDMMQYSNYLPFYLKRLWKSSIIKINFCLTDGLSWNNARLCSWVLSKNLSHACQP